VSPELLAALALTAHGNARLRGNACSCGESPVLASPLSSLRRFIADDSLVNTSAREWLEALKTRSATRLWVNVFENEGRGRQWALEVELPKSAEVWRVRRIGSDVELEKIFFQLPLQTRSPQLAQASQRLHVALSEAHGDAVECRDLALAAVLLEARDCLDGAGPPEKEHVFPDVGYPSEARALFRAAQHVGTTPLAGNGIAQLVHQAVLAAALAATHSTLT
jgi:hypothetical protein